jgi:hypothetical protein
MSVLYPVVKQVPSRAPHCVGPRALTHNVFVAHENKLFFSFLHQQIFILKCQKIIKIKKEKPEASCVIPKSLKSFLKN